MKDKQPKQPVQPVTTPATDMAAPVVPSPAPGTTGTPMPDTTPPGEETQEMYPDADLDDDQVEKQDDQPEGEGGDGGAPYDGGEIPPAPTE